MAQRVDDCPELPPMRRSERFAEGLGRDGRKLGEIGVGKEIDA